MHSPISPSGAHRWTKCTASVKACRNLPDDESDAAREGTAAHELAEKMVLALQVGGKLNENDFVGTIAENGVVFTAEMFEGAQVYADEIINLMSKTGVFSGENIGIESKVFAPYIHEKSFGYIDFYLFDDKSKTLHVYDFKFGFKPVSPVENLQLSNYACGLLNGFKDQTYNVVFNIVQPRAFGFEKVRRWSCKSSDLTGVFNLLKNKAAEALSDEATFETGDHCSYCLNLLKCEAAQNAQLNALEFISKRANVIISDNLELSKELIELKRAQNIVEMMLEAKQTEAMARMKLGENFPDFEIGSGRSSTKWSKPANEIFNIADLCKIDIRKEPQPLTPKQAIKAGLSADIVEAMSENKPGAPKLRRIDIKRTKEILNND
jgi:hypothetical protein